MDRGRLAEPVVVCLDGRQAVGLLVECGVALARLWDAPLHLAVVLVVPPQRPLGLVSQDEERTVNALLDLAAEHATASGLVPVQGIWIARSWEEAFQEMAETTTAAAIVMGWRRSGPLDLFDAGRTLLKTVPCPIIMVGDRAGSQRQRDWPPRWLAEAHLQMSG